MFSNHSSRLAKNLYTSKARFIFELLQNADDNSFIKAIALDALPLVSFHVYPRRIVVECNEDGFTSENLMAICSVGMSSKMGAQGYAGEKGIGFKSVFMAAWKVHIQSGAFSFSFTHKIGDPGMGMISPVWENTEGELEPPLTRMTLYLHESGDQDILAKTREIIKEQFRELQETILLFMKNLKKIHVSFYQENGEPQSSATYSIERPRRRYAVLRKVTICDGTTQEDVKYFHVTTHQVANLARNENRKYSKTEESTGVYSRSQIVLAFPLSETDVPIIKPQDVFVYLPVRSVGFKFIIQADFVTDASRQDIVKDSLRNCGLRQGIADAFAKAVLQFCTHGSLRHQWMRYLPHKTNNNLDHFWLSLANEIEKRLRNTPVLYCHKMNDLHPIGDLVRLTQNLYENGQPLFDDGDTEKIISQRYDREDLDILDDYGLQYPAFDLITEWLRQDLRRGDLSTSRMKSPQTTNTWHTQVAELLLTAFRDPTSKNSAKIIGKLRLLDLLPLQDGTWASVASGCVYFAKAEGIDIPPGINLRVLKTSVTNTQRLILFKKLGVVNATVSLVRMKILEKYSADRDPTNMALETSRGHLEFLYLTQHLKGENEPSYMRLSIQCQTSSFYRTCDRSIYIADKNDPYGPWELFRKTRRGDGPGDGARGYPATFMNVEYFNSIPERPPEQELTWREWFTHHLDVENHVRFFIKDSTSWYNEPEYLRSKRPDKFLGALRIHHQHHPEPSDDFIECVKQTEVLCRSNRLVPLEKAYFKTQALEELVEKHVEPNAFFPWLWLDSEITYDAIPLEWKGMLTAYGVGWAGHVNFALHMLQYSLNALQASMSISYPSITRLFGLYNHIQARYREEGSTLDARTKIRWVVQDSAST